MSALPRRKNSNASPIDAISSKPIAAPNDWFQNGSAFGGLGANTDWFNTTLGLAMLVGRFVLMVLVLALAGSLARKQAVPPSAGTFPTGTPTFTGLLVAVILVVVGLTYLPALALGPIVEALQL